MYITSSKSYRQIILTVLKVVGVVSIFLAPIALLQVISASKQHDIKREIRDEIRQTLIDSQISEPDLHSAAVKFGQLGELFDVSPRKDRRDSKSILRLRRQADDATPPDLAKLTAAGTAAGMILGDQMAAAQMAAETTDDPEQPSADEDDESDTDGPTGQNVDLSTLQSLKQQAPQGDGSLNQQQQDQADNINPEQMPDSMDSLMRSEQEDMGADQGDDEQNNQQPSASSPVAGDQQALSVRDDDHADDADETKYQNPLRTAVDLPQSYLPIQGQTSNFVQATTNAFSGVSFPTNGISSPVIDSLDDLSAAAGHHYKKKKKKKIIITKKKKSGKKYKKLKKVKIIKYKKKKVVKKKKPKKHHHHHVHDHGKYYMYAKVPKKNSWEFGFKKGNKKHWIERHEKGHKNKFKTKVKWFDKKSKGKGVHIWDYNHHDKKKKKHY